ncbi:hypothetical protein R5H30_00580 [Sulfitobacter sp. D35]|uniref:VOC family protein n=1 Tax=Sulfitobacter sp. D35 TaxID=3083252 RepID=UPI00296F317F|nr:VOC family protein [Sulfitobacter sp. D35]MDW4496459.1 hypothetical protein [Sulfitobacter sp. D35]
MQTLRAMPVLDVSDVAASVAFYDRLGFASHGIWGEPGSFAIVQRGDVTLGLSLSDHVHRNHGWAAYVYVSDVEALHAEFETTGAAPSAIRHPEHYGCDDFDIADPDGHRIAFGQSRNPVPGPGLDHDRGKG